MTRHLRTIEIKVAGPDGKHCDPTCREYAFCSMDRGFLDQWDPVERHFLRTPACLASTQEVES